MSNYPYKASSNDYGGGSLGLLGETLPDTIKIEHVFTLKFSDKWERPLGKLVDKCLDLSKYYSESFRFIAAGVGSYLFFLGVSKVVQASRGSGSSDDSSCTNTKKNKTKCKDKYKSKDSNYNTIRAGSSSRKAKAKDDSITTQLESSSTTPKLTTIEVPTSDSKPRATP